MTTWPTSEQFDQASTLGTEYALQERASGATEAQEAPLSGEWADGITARDVARNVGFNLTVEQEIANIREGAEAVHELADAWETAYFDQWRV